jgi:histidine triad (HIT) family protein
VRRIAFAFTGGDVDHAHAHVFPIVEKTDITSRRYVVEQQVTFREAPRMHDDDLAEHKAKLVQALAAVG